LDRNMKLLTTRRSSVIHTNSFSAQPKSTRLNDFLCHHSQATASRGIRCEIY
jgi:hypothetical protein